MCGTLQLNFFLLHCVLNSAKTRQAALEGIKNALASKMLYEFILERRMTLTDSIERCLKKGNILVFELEAQNQKGVFYFLCNNMLMALEDRLSCIALELSRSTLCLLKLKPRLVRSFVFVYVINSLKLGRVGMIVILYYIRRAISSHVCKKGLTAGVRCQQKYYLKNHSTSLF